MTYFVNVDPFIMQEKIKRNLVKDFISRIDKFASQYLEKPDYVSEDSWPRIYEDITPYVAKLLHETCLLAQEQLYSNPAEHTLFVLARVLETTNKALISGPEVLESEPGFLHNFTYLTSPLAQQCSDKIKSDIMDMIKEYGDMHNYFVKLSTLQGKIITDWEIFLFDIEFNHYKSDSFILSPWVSNHSELDDNDISQIFSAVEKNRFIKKIVIQHTDEETTTQILKTLLHCKNIQGVELVIYPHNMEILAKSHLSHIVAKGDVITDQEVEFLAGTNPHLQRVKLVSDNISEASLIALSRNSSVKEVTFSSNCLTDEGLLLVNTCLKESNIRKLKLTSDAITEKGMRVIAENENLVAVSISSEKLTNDAKNIFLSNRTLSELRLYSSQMKEPGVQYFSSTLPEIHPNRKYIKQYLLALDDKEFMDKARSSTYVQLVLNDDELCMKLNDIAVDVRTQTYQKSCAARSLMLLLNKFGIIPDNEVTVKKELEIYSQIWTESGEVADFGLILNYLASHNLTFQVLEDTQRTSALFTDPQIKEAYISAFESKKAKIPVKQIITADVFQKNNQQSAYYLLVTVPGTYKQSKDIGHIVLLAYENNQYCIFDPGKGHNVTKNSSDEILEEMESAHYAGIAIQIYPPACALLKAPSRNGFFTPPQNKKFIQEDSKQCLIQ